MNPKTKRWIFLFFTAALAGLLYLIHEILLPFVFSGLFVYLLAPLVDYLSKQKFLGRTLPRGITVMLVYIFVFLGVAILGLIVLPPLYQEVLRMGRDLPHQLEHFRAVTLPSLVQQAEFYNTKFGLRLDVETYLAQGLETVIKAGKGQIESMVSHVQTLIKLLFSALSTFLVIFIVTAFLLIDLPRIKVELIQLIPKRYRPLVLDLVHAIDRDLSGTIRGQLLICLINGTLTTLGLLLLKVKFAITIGFVAGIFSLIPVFGAVISTVPAVIIALTQSWLTALAVIGVIIIIHLIEANFLNPKILGHTVELHPAIIVFSIVVGEHFFGAVGLLFGVPVAAILRSVLRYIYLTYLADPEEEAEQEPVSAEAEQGAV
jgi:predicted PurR-regulated permease PerM